MKKTSNFTGMNMVIVVAYHGSKFQLGVVICLEYNSLAMASGLRLRLRSRIRKDGVLELHTPTPLPEGEVEVDLWVQPIEAESALPVGTPGSALLDLAGTLPEHLAEQMLQAIEEGCEGTHDDSNEIPRFARNDKVSTPENYLSFRAKRGISGFGCF